MNLRSWTKTQIAGILAIAVGLMSLLTNDFLLGAVWALLGFSLIMYVSSPDTDTRAPRRFEPGPRNYLALAAVVIALALLVISFLDVIG